MLTEKVESFSFVLEVADAIIRMLGREKRHRVRRGRARLIRPLTRFPFLDQASGLAVIYHVRRNNDGGH